MSDTSLTPNSSALRFAFLQAGGELIETIRAFDWSATPLGPIEAWSPALRMVLSFMLANRQPMFLSWGPQHIGLYNDTCRSLLGSKHPNALGQPATAWFGEIWNRSKPQIDTSLLGGSATYDEDLTLVINRNGFNEETHWQVAFNPVPDESVPGSIGGVLATMNDMTAKVLSERRWTVLRDLGRQSERAKSAHEACFAVAKTLENHAKDIPFALLYLSDASGKQARLSATTAIEKDHDIGPAVIDLVSGAEPWPLAEARRTLQPLIVRDLASRFANVPAGPWSDAPNTAVILPILASKPHAPAGFLIAGVSSHLTLDDAYLGFLDLVTARIGFTLAHAFAQANAREEERSRDESLAELGHANVAAGSPGNHDAHSPNPLVRSTLDAVMRNSAESSPRDHNLPPTRDALNFDSSRNRLAKSSSDAQVRQSKPRILVVDDNAEMRQCLRSLLSNTYEVETVADGRAALEAISQSPPDLILTDVMMPHVDGFGLLEQLRGDLHTASIPVIMVSARSGEENRAEGMEACADDYLVKPFSVRELLARVSAHLQIARVRQQTTESLRKQEEELRKAQQVAHVGSWHWDAATDVSSGSEELYRIHGLDPKTQSFPKFKDQDGLFYAHEEWARLNRAVQNTLRTGVGYELDLQAFRGGQPIWITTRGEVVRDGQGNIVGLTGTAQDITERMLAEMALRQSEERVRLLWEAAAVLLTTDDPDTMLRQLFAKIGPHLKLDTYFNFMVNDEGNALKLASCIGIDDETARGIERLEFGQAVCGTVAMLRKALTASFIQESDDSKVQLVKSFGIRAYACNPLLAGDQLLGTLSFASRTRDEFSAEELDFLQTICQYVTAAYERLRLIGKLREADRRKDEFLASLAHELRNPLAPIRNGLQILRLGGSGEIAETARKMMERQLAQMVRLIDDLLDLSRISRGKIQLRSERLELVKVIQQAVETSRPLIDQAGHELLIDVPIAPIYVDGDLTRLAQVFSNLLNNAAKYTEQGGRVQLIAQRQGTEVTVSVKDNGLGIPLNMLPKVFDMFTQVDRNLERSQGGLGIGLSIVRSLVEMHGGSIKAKSDGHGMGSEFIVRLPVALSVAEMHEIDEKANRHSSLRRILVADDNRDAATSLAIMLELMGNEVKTAHDGLEALDVALLFRPELIFLDIGMPRLNGHETAKRIREQPWGKSITLVALTGWGQEEDRRKSEEAGFNFHIVKPIEPAALEKLLSSLAVKPA